MSKKVINPEDLPLVIDTPCFLWFVEYYTQFFFRQNGRHYWIRHDGSYAKWRKNHRGYGRWLNEYRLMDAQGMFTPERLQELYKPILMDTSKLPYIQWDAVNYICSRAQQMSEQFIIHQTYEIRIITGELALDDNDRELTGLSLNSALKLRNAMNEEAEEELFVVYNSKKHQPIPRGLYQFPTF